MLTPFHSRSVKNSLKNEGNASECVLSPFDLEKSNKRILNTFSKNSLFAGNFGCPCKC